MIKVQCQCGQILEAPVQLAGKKAACPKCRQQIIVPAPAARQPNQQPVNNVNADGNGFTWAVAPPETNPLGPQPQQTSLPPIGGTLPPTIAPQYQPPATLGNPADYRLGIAAVLSFWIPGLGQIFKRQVKRGLMFNAIVVLLLGFAGGLVAVGWAYNAKTWGVKVGFVPAEAGIDYGTLATIAYVLAAIVMIGCAVVWYHQLCDAAGVK